MKPKQLSVPKTSPIPQGPSGPASSGSLHQQEQALLFTKLSTEIRIIIYQHVLADPVLPLHIVPYEDRSGKLGHCRCKDFESPYPKWQHKCFGWWLNPDKTRTRQMCPSKSDKLLALLLTCRLIYSEASEVLYVDNLFSFKGAYGILALRNTVPRTHWRAIRKVHVSTVFLTPYRFTRYCDPFPPDDYYRWVQACTALRTMSSLRSLHLEIIVWDEMDHDNVEAVDDLSLIAIFQLLKSVNVFEFVVEMNLDLPQAVLNALGSVNFSLLVKQRPYNHELFPTW